MLAVFVPFVSLTTEHITRWLVAIDLEEHIPAFLAAFTSKKLTGKKLQYVETNEHLVEKGIRMDQVDSMAFFDEFRRSKDKGGLLVNSHAIIVNEALAGSNSVGAEVHCFNSPSPNLLTTPNFKASASSLASPSSSSSCSSLLTTNNLITSNNKGVKRSALLISSGDGEVSLSQSPLVSHPPMQISEDVSSGEAKVAFDPRSIASAVDGLGRAFKEDDIDIFAAAPPQSRSPSIPYDTDRLGYGLILEERYSSMEFTSGLMKHIRGR